jgi:glyoxylase-like metal-dependent hydrolase (beta-lactamase superfamily II)
LNSEPGTRNWEVIVADWQRVQARGADVELCALQVGTFENVVYVVRDPDTREGYVIDAGWEPDTIADAVKDTRVKSILITHGHHDHHEGSRDQHGQLAALKEKLGVPVGIGAGDEGMFESPPDFSISDGQEFTFGKTTMRAVHTPGHTPGSTCYVVGNLLFSGDTLFPGGPGNTKTSTGDFPTIIASIRDRLFTLPEDTVVYPGHGKGTTIGTEKPHLDEWAARGW